MSSRASSPICFQSQWRTSGLTASVAASGISNIGGADNRENQDAFFTFYDPKNAALVVGLFDGHGRDTGHDVKVHGNDGADVHRQNKSYGVSCEPTVVELSLEQIVAKDLGLTTKTVDNQVYNHTNKACDGDEDRTFNSSDNPSEQSFMLVVASDGIWDNWKYCDLQMLLSEANHNKSKHQQSEITGDHSSVDAIVSSLMDANLQRASSYFGDNADNMTAILCNFNLRTSANK
ncbi:hypothetical protein PInf_002933 [Phytophthora infestans]|nr:hypothetical protein PInf_002933 [Phytophthora infestans]